MKDFGKNAFSGLARKIGIVSLMAICFALFSSNINAQTVLVDYDFASTTASVNTTTPCTLGAPLSTAMGVTSSFTVGGTGTNTGVCTTPGGAAAASPPAFVANSSNQAVSVNGFTTGSSNYFQFQLSGVSTFENYMLFFQNQASSTGPDNIDIQYSTDGTNFTTFQTVTPATAIATSGQVIDLSSVTAIEGQSTVYFRLFARRVAAAGGAAGTFRIDNFQVQATTIAAAPTNDLTISQSAPASVTANSSFTYTLTVTNTGSASFTNVDVNFTLPTGVTYISASSSCTGATTTPSIGGTGTVNFTGCSVAANGTTVLTVTVAAPGTAQTITSNGTAVVVDPANSVAESNNLNNNAADFTTNVTLGSTAAMVNVGGRVTNSKGRGISGATVMMTDGNGNNFSAATDSTGNYLFEGVEVGQTLIFNVQAKRVSFTQPSQVVSLTEETITVNFTGYEAKRFGL